MSTNTMFRSRLGRGRDTAAPGFSGRSSYSSSGGAIFSKTGGLVVSKLLLSLIAALAHGVLYFVLDAPFWLPMALWVGLTSQSIPTIGTYLGI